MTGFSGDLFKVFQHRADRKDGDGLVIIERSDRAGTVFMIVKGSLDYILNSFVGQ